jgi:predicted RNA-binding protein with PUA-like domain
LKSEPNVWSIDQQKKAGTRGITWDGVRNDQARNNLKKITKAKKILLLLLVESLQTKVFDKNL